MIDSWLAQNEQNKALFNKICSDNTIRKKIYNYKNSDAEQAFNNFLKARKQRSNRRIYYRFLSGAAVIAICFGFWALLRIQETQSLQVTETEQQPSDMTANKPVLTLGDGTRMNVWGDNLYFKETEKGQKIMLGDSLLSQKEDSITADSYNTLEVPLKCDFSFTMSDGTRRLKRSHRIGHFSCILCLFHSVLHRASASGGSRAGPCAPPCLPAQNAVPV